jgi:hypothetical protein
MRQYRIIILIGFFLVFSAFTGIKLDTNKINNLENRVKHLEEYKTDIDLYSKTAVLGIKNDSNSEIKAQFKNIEEAKMLLYILLAMGLPTTLWGVYMMFWGITKKTNKLISEKIETIVEHKREDLIKLFDSQEFDTRLRNTKKILVISGTIESQESIQNLIKRLNFKTVIYRVAERDTNLPEHDLLIFNDWEGNLGQNFIDSILQNTDDEDVSFVAYTNQRLTPDHRLNFSNNRYTLYHSMMSTLKYSEILNTVEE